MLNAEGITTYVSLVLCKTSGFRTDELPGRHFTEFVTGEDKERLILEFSNLFKEPVSIKTFSARIRKKIAGSAAWNGSQGMCSMSVVSVG